jgi:hypothetical protein
VSRHARARPTCPSISFRSSSVAFLPASALNRPWLSVMPMGTLARRASPAHMHALVIDPHHLPASLRGKWHGVTAARFLSILPQAARSHVQLALALSTPAHPCLTYDPAGKARVAQTVWLSGAERCRVDHALVFAAAVEEATPRRKQVLGYGSEPLTHHALPLGLGLILKPALQGQQSVRLCWRIPEETDSLIPSPLAQWLRRRLLSSTPAARRAHVI